MSAKKDIYTHGHHEAVLISHKWRTVENSAKYLIPHLKDLQDGARVLDAGCGPGNISAELAELIPHGKVTAIDNSTEIVNQAKIEFPKEKYGNLEFEQGDIYKLNFAENTFDVIHIHQVLQHLKNPVAALIELKRVLKPGGILGCREADHAAFAWYPELTQLDRWMEIYREVTSRNRAECNGGRFLKAWNMKAGLQIDEVACTAWVFESAKERRWWGEMWSRRATESDFAKQAIAYDISNEEELRKISDAFLEWANDPAGYFMIPNTEVIAFKPLATN